MLYIASIGRLDQTSPRERYRLVEFSPDRLQQRLEEASGLAVFPADRNSVREMLAHYFQSQTFDLTDGDGVLDEETLIVFQRQGGGYRLRLMVYVQD